MTAEKFVDPGHTLLVEKTFILIPMKRLPRPVISP